MLACAGTGAGGQMALVVSLASVGPRCQAPSPRAGPLSRCSGSFQRVEAHRSSVPHVSGHSIVRRSAPPACRAATSTTAQEESAMRARSQTSSVLAMILGGGAGSRLYPLTNSRAKPAVPIGGAYRLIDVPMSNCLNSGISKIYILTQFNSTSLNRHLARTYNLGASGVRFGGEAFVEVLAASQTPKEKAWFQGTADAVRQYMWLLEDVRHREVEDVIVLSGDHLYRMDYMQFVDAHRQSGADISIGCLPVDEHRASDFGLMQIDGSGRVRSFSEKPKGEALEKMKVDTTVLGLDAAAARRTPYIASMGIYVFKRHVMAELLRDYDSCNDFGGEIIPAAARERHVQAYLFNGYWEDIGTIESFFHANISLCANPPNFEFHDPRGPIYTSPRFLPPAKIEDCLLHDAVVSHGAVLARCEVRNAIVGLRSRVEEGVVVQNALVMGADYYESDARRAALRAKGEVPLGIGRGSRLDQVVLDKNARVGENVVIANREGVQEASREEQGVYIRSGIVVVARNTTIPSGTVI